MSNDNGSLRAIAYTAGTDWKEVLNNMKDGITYSFIPKEYIAEKEKEKELNYDEIFKDFEKK